MHSSLRMQTGDATKLPPELQPAALIFTCFALQQMPDPCAVLAAWLSALAPGGVLAGELLAVGWIFVGHCHQMRRTCSLLLAD